VEIVFIKMCIHFVIYNISKLIFAVDDFDMNDDEVEDGKLELHTAFFVKCD
jgi:hypothetical protein